MKETNESLQGVNREINLDILKFTLLLDCIINKIMRRTQNSFCIESLAIEKKDGEMRIKIINVKLNDDNLLEGR